MAVVVGLARRRDVSLAVGCLLATSALYLITGMARSGLHARDYADSSRYVYVAAFFLVLAAVEMIGVLPRPHLGPRRRLAVVAGSSVVLTAWALGNARETNSIYSYFQDAADLTRMYSYIGLRDHDAPWVDGDAELDVVPSVDDLVAAVATHGSPISGRFPSNLSSERRIRLENAALLLLVGDRFHVDRSPDLAARAVQLPDLEIAGATVERRGACVRLRARAAGRLDFGLSAAGSYLVRLTSSRNSSGRVGLRRGDGPTRYIGLALERGHPVDVVMPTMGDARPARIVVGLPDPGDVRVCAARS
jgi:hypothetical protein